MNDGGKSGRDMQQRIAQLEFGLRNILKLAHAGNVHLHQFATNQDKERNISQLRAAAEANARILEYSSELNLSASYDRNRKRLASLFQHMINGFTYCRSIRNKNGEIIDLRFIEANTAFYKIMGKKPEEILNRGFREIFPAPGACDSILNAIKKLDRHGGAIETEEHFAPLDKWLMLSAFSTDKDYFALLLYDITSKKKGEDRLSAALVRATKANKDKDQFLARPGLTPNKHAARTVRRGLQGMQAIPDLNAFADYALTVEILVQILFQALFPIAQTFPDSAFQAFHVQGFQQVIQRAIAYCLLGRINIAAGRDYDHLGAAFQFPELGYSLNAATTGHDDVEKYYVCGFVPERRKAVFAGQSRPAIMAYHLNLGLERVAKIFVIIYNQNVRHNSTASGFENLLKMWGRHFAVTAKYRNTPLRPSA